MKTIIFSLSMPGCPSWNGRWSGDDQPHLLVRRVGDEVAAQILSTGSWYYRWSDGWCACVSAHHAKPGDARKARAKSVGFAGYDWMVESIIRDNEIRLESRP